MATTPKGKRSTPARGRASARARGRKKAAQGEAPKKALHALLTAIDRGASGLSRLAKRADQKVAPPQPQSRKRKAS